MNKFIIDVSIGRFVEEFLLRKNIDFKTVRQINPELTDKEILEIAVSEKRIVVTMDKDFGELVYNSGYPHSGVLLLRLEDENADEKIKIISHIIDKYSDKLKNHFCVYQNRRFRIRS